MASAVEQQSNATTAVARSANETLQFAGAVSEGACEIRDVAAHANGYGKSVEQHGHDVIALAQKLRTRVTMFLRQSEAGDRRRHDRLPCQLGVELRTDGGVIIGHTADVSDGGMLVRVDDMPEMAPLASNAMLQAKIDGIGATRVRLAGSSPLGLHLEFLEMGSAVRAALEHKLAAIREENREIISRAVDVANDISRVFEGLIEQKKLTQDDLFDNDYVVIDGSNPMQYRTRFLSALEEVLPPILGAVSCKRPAHGVLRGGRQKRLLASPQSQVFLAAASRRQSLEHGKFAQPPDL